MEIIDFERKGNVVRFYLGKNGEQWGSDWDDAPYSLNAERVSPEYIEGIKDISFPFDEMVLEPCSGTTNEPYCKKDMIDRRIPCIIVVPETLAKEEYYYDSFEYWKAADGVKKFYFGDEMDVDIK